MSLYNDLTDVLTPYASKIKEVNESLDSIEPVVNNMAYIASAYTGNVVNTTGQTAPASTLDGTIHFTLDKGVYYQNPFANNGHDILLYPKDSSGNAIAIHKNGSTSDCTHIETYVTYACVLTVSADGKTIVVDSYQEPGYFYLGRKIRNETYVCEETPAYWTFVGTRFTKGDAISIGYTKGYLSSTYVAYTTPTEEYYYDTDFDEHIENVMDEYHDIFTASKNILDHDKIIWETPINGYYQLPLSYYIPVTEGTVLVTNNSRGFYDFYDSSYDSVGSQSFSVPYLPVTVPADAVWMKISFNQGYVTQSDNVMIWVAASEASAPYERPIYRPSKQFVAKYFDGSLFNYAAPQSLTQDIMRWSRFVSLRAMNESRDAYRFGTFNTFVSKGTKGFPQIREMLMDYGIDFCGFQECVHAGTEIGAAVYNWQFPYNSGARASDYDGVPAVSRFEVVNVSTTTLEEGTGHSVKKITVNLPRNKHYRVATLSVFNYHGTLSSNTQVAEAQQIVSMVNQDTADFKIIMGDTNDGGAEKAAWDVFESAGYAAVHHGESPTWPSSDGQSRYESEDNIFVGSNINVLHYDIIRTGTGEITLEDGTTALSDHDFLFADLQFDFDTVLKNTWTR